MIDGAEILALPAELADDLADAVARKSCSLAGLRQFHMRAASGYGRSEADCLPWLLTQATQLSVLSVYVGERSFLWLPPMCNLKHIILVLPKRGSNLPNALLSATALETLSLSVRSKLGSPCGIHCRIKALELDRLRSLSQVVLRGVSLDRMKLPASCCLHVYNIYLHNLCEQEATQEHHARIRSIGVIIDMSGADVSYPVRRAGLAVADFLALKCPSLQMLNMLTLHLSEAISGQRIDLGNFQQFRNVCFEGSSLKFDVPAGSSWDVLRIEALTLDFQIEDAYEFPFSCPSFSAAMNDECSIGGWMVDLCETLLKRGIPWTKEKVGPKRFRVRYSRVPGNVWCSCGACMDCLLAAGHAKKPDGAARALYEPY